MSIRRVCSTTLPAFAVHLHRKNAWEEMIAETRDGQATRPRR